MTPTDLPQSILFLIFLALFVLLGIYPAWQRTAALIRKYLADSNKSAATNIDSYSTEPAEIIAVQQSSLQLDTLESLVFQRLIQNDNKSLSRKQINADLHLEPALLKNTLESLLQKGLLRVTLTTLLTPRFQLTEKGHGHALHIYVARQ